MIYLSLVRCFVFTSLINDRCMQTLELQYSAMDICNNEQILGRENVQG